MKLTGTRALIVAAALTLALVTASCGSDSSDDGAQAETTSGAEQTQTEIKSEELEGELVDSFPADVPLYDGDIIESSGQMSDVSGAPEWGVLMSTSDSIEAVDESIRAAYSSDGWAIGSDSESGNGHLLVARKTGYTVSITYNDMFGSNITIIYGVSATG